MLPSISPQGTPIPRPYVRFESRPSEVRTSEGTTYVDESWAIITTPGSRDNTEIRASEWIQNLEAHSKAGRVPMTWPREYAEALKEWERTQEMPVQGTALKLWPAISPGQLKGCQNIGILSVEQLAEANAEALARIGMGAISLKLAAQAWLKEQAGPGALAAQLQNLLLRQSELERTNQELHETIKALKAAQEA